ncbi:hypothetical protein ALO52_200112 [Pseudomonas syringae pv. primulae]|uniref:Glycosyltransferase 2-like domain-containing protein n=1 Tax=Pseudomonas syringae pv. primulae TaxID=251707 RepID=A0A0P9YDR4_9PSED|nr:hypothetical protein ALO52_200112 [Pseudomonas syringae pv. primulae]
MPKFPTLLRTQWPLPAALPRVSLIVPTRDQLGLLRTCIEGLLTATDYPDLEIIVVDNQSSDPQTLVYLEQLSERGVKVCPTLTLSITRPSTITPSPTPPVN